jgi:hypothetical protein
MNLLRSTSLAALALALVASPGPADWPQFRGPGGLGVAPDQGLPTRWGADENIVWKTPLPGPGASSPIVVGDRIFVTSYSGHGADPKNVGSPADLKRHLVCLDRSGKVLWTSDVVTEARDTPYSQRGFQGLHGFASGTPASDGQHVYVFFGVAGVLAYDLDGKELWRTSVGTRSHDWGSATSPVLFKDLVIVNAGVESNALVALNKKTGKVAWSAKGMNAAWDSPLLIDAGGRPELVISVQGQLRAFDPATGKELWSSRGIQDYVCPTVVAHEGVVFAIGGRQNTAMAVKAGGSGDVTDTHVLWKIKKGSNVSSPVYHAGRLYWANEMRGVAYCVDARTGDVLYEETLQPRPDRIYASPVLADGKIYYVSRTEGTYVVAAGPQFKLLAHNRIADDPSVFNASPAVADGQLLLRSDRFLYCIGARK